MVLVRETSRGTLALELSNLSRWTGLSVNAFELGADGWSSALGAWNARYSRGVPLERFLAEEVGLPREEAERLAAEALDGYRERGGTQTLGRAEWLVGFALAFVSLTARYVLPVVIIVGIAFLLIRLIG